MEKNSREISEEESRIEEDESPISFKRSYLIEQKGETSRMIELMIGMMKRWHEEDKHARQLERKEYGHITLIEREEYEHIRLIEREEYERIRLIERDEDKSRWQQLF